MIFQILQTIYKIYLFHFCTNHVNPSYFYNKNLFCYVKFNYQMYQIYSFVFGKNYVNIYVRQ